MNTFNIISCDFITIQCLLGDTKDIHFILTGSPRNVFNFVMVNKNISDSTITLLVEDKEADRQEVSL